MPLVLKVCLGIFDNSSRDQRELAAAREAGFDVMALAAPRTPEDSGKTEQVHGFTVHRWGRVEPPNPPRALPYIYILTYAYSLVRQFFRRLWLKGRRWWLARFFRTSEIRSFHADVLSGHDIQALALCYRAVRWMPKAKRPKLVYDSHEFELGRNTKIPRTRREIKRLAKKEKFLMNKCAFSIMVNDSIADEVQRIHGLKERPLVVRSMTENWPLDEIAIAAQRKEFLSGFGASGTGFIAMYHGGLTFNRGIELFLDALVQTPEIYGILLGFPTSNSYLEGLKASVEEMGLSNRVQFWPAVPLAELWRYVGAADVGLVSFQNTCQSYYFSLPNKFFENVQSLTPVVCSDLPELRRLVEQYDIGLLYPDDSAEAMGACLEKLRTDKVLYAHFKENLKAAKKDLCWQNEKGRLVDAYRALLPGGGQNEDGTQ